MRYKVWLGAQELILSSHNPPPAARPHLGNPVQYLPQINGNLRTYSGERREVYVLFQQRDEQRQSQGRQVSAHNEFQVFPFHFMSDPTLIRVKNILISLILQLQRPRSALRGRFWRGRTRRSRDPGPVYGITGRQG